MRQQLTLFLPTVQRVLVDSFRARLDPRQHAGIAAHATLCRDDELAPWPEIRQHLEGLEPFSITLQFGDPELLQDGGILLRATHGEERYQALRKTILGPSAKDHGAHITLLHPRNATGATHDLDEISRSLSGLSATFCAVSHIIQRRGGPWMVQKVYGAAV